MQDDFKLFDLEKWVNPVSLLESNKMSNAISRPQLIRTQGLVWFSVRSGPIIPEKLVQPMNKDILMSQKCIFVSCCKRVDISYNLIMILSLSHTHACTHRLETKISPPHHWPFKEGHVYYLFKPFEKEKLHMSVY